MFSHKIISLHDSVANANKASTLFWFDSIGFAIVACDRSLSPIIFRRIKLRIAFSTHRLALSLAKEATKNKIYGYLNQFSLSVLLINCYIVVQFSEDDSLTTPLQQCFSSFTKLQQIVLSLLIIYSHPFVSFFPFFLLNYFNKISLFQIPNRLIFSPKIHSELLLIKRSLRII